ncbi:hypothetical protein [Azotosporobacter soli]|uniref:hypothetical protein n=1 Tax=Azotosporobacter soli TaxID=3055040 RepID=UPI0031FE611D
MKKSIALTLLGLTFSAFPIAQAAPLTLNGDVSVSYEKDTAADAASSGSRYTLRLKGESELGSGWSLYGRVTAQYANNPSFGDYNLAAYGGEQKSVFSFDQFGLIHKNEQFVYKIGRQDAAVGKTALLYSRADSNIGKRTFVDGLSLSGTTGKTEIAALLAQEDNVGADDNRVYALRGGYNATDKLNFGLTLARYQDKVNESTNHWAVDGSYTFGKSSLTAEYTKSSSASENKAFALVFNYNFDDKTTLSLTKFRVESNGDMGKQSDFDNNNSGIYYGVAHKLNKAETLELVYKDQKSLNDGQKNSKFEATLTHSF